MQRWTASGVFGGGDGPSRNQGETLDAIRKVASRLASAMGLEVVEVVLHGAGRRSHLRIDIDRAGPERVGIDECRRLSEALGAEFDEADLIGHSYTLEVSSPGLDRPIRTADDVRRNTGRWVVAHTRVAVAGRRSFRGVLLGQEDGNFRLREENGLEIEIPLEEILEAHQDPGF